MKKQYLWAIAGIFLYGNANQFAPRRRSHPATDFTKAEYRHECEQVFNVCVSLEKERDQLSLDNIDLQQECSSASQRIRELEGQNKELRATITKLKTSIVRLRSEKELIGGELKTEQKANQRLKLQSKDAFSNWLHAQQAEEREKKLVKHFAEMQRAKKLKEEMFSRWKKKYFKRSHL